MKICLPLFLAALTFSALRADDPSVSWPPPPWPPGPLATNPMPRIDWLYTFQDRLKKYPGPHDMIWEGDSITDFWQTRGKEVWAAHFGNIKTADFGISGDQVQHVLWRVQHGQLDGQDPKLVMLMIGTNNLGQNQKDARTRRSCCWLSSRAARSPPIPAATGWQNSMPSSPPTPPTHA
jgi:hypothetical protein